MLLIPQIALAYASMPCVWQVCGSPDIPLNLLKSVATYKGIDASASLIQWFWEVMEEFTNTERSLFLRFVWGRTRLPRTIADFRGRDFVIQVTMMTSSLLSVHRVTMIHFVFLSSMEDCPRHSFHCRNSSLLLNNCQ